MPYPAMKQQKRHHPGGTSTFVSRIQLRKTKRKEERKLKKMRIHAFKQGKQLPTTESLEQERLVMMKALEKKKKKAQAKQKRKLRKKAALQKKEEVADERQVALLEDNRRDERVLKQLEKSLGMKKKKSTNLPAAFVRDGLDFLLDVVDPEKLKCLTEEIEPGAVWNESDSDQELSDNEMDINDSAEAAAEEDDKLFEDDMENVEDDTVSDSDDSDDDDDDGVGSESDDNIDRIITDNDDHSESKDTKYSPVNEAKMKRLKDLEELVKSASSSGVKSILKHQADERQMKQVKFDKDNTCSSELHEDIYGRMRDERGNIIDVKNTSGTAGTYVPPGKRQQLLEGTKGNEERQQKLQMLTRQIKGLINRLSESNMQSICKSVESLYTTNARADMTSTLSAVILEALLLPSLAPRRVCTDAAMLLAVIHCRVGNEVTASFLQELVDRFHQLFDNATDDKQMDNAVAFLSHMYNFKIISCQLIFDVAKMLTQRFCEHDIEVLLSLMKGAGFGLRKDDPTTLKDLLMELQRKATDVDVSSFSDPSRVKFLLDSLVAVRNNNIHKLIDAEQQQHLQHQQKLLKAFVKGCSDCPLNVSLDDLINASQKGKWFLVGSAWHGAHQRKDDNQMSALEAESSSKPVVSDRMMELSRKLGMNTELRRAIFYTLMGSEDYVDAFEKLVRLISNQQQQQREVVHIVFKLCLQEKTFNAFYACLLDKLCHYHRQFLITVQFSVRDHLRMVNELGTQKSQNLADLIVHLIASSALSLTVFKDIDFAELSKPLKNVLGRVLRGLIFQQSQSVTEKVFRRIAGTAHLELLRDGLRLFLAYFTRHERLSDNATDNEFQQTQTC